MRSQFCSIAALAAVAACSPGSVQSGNLQTLPSQIPGIVARSQATNQVTAGTSMELRVSLPLNNTDELSALLADMYDPNSPSYHAYLSPSMFAAQYQATAEQTQKVIDALTAEGFTAAASAHGSLLSVGGTADKIESFFHTKLLNYTAPDGTAFVAPASDLQVPEDLPIGTVIGVSRGLAHHTNMAMPQARTQSGLLPTATSVRKAYGLPANPDGAGQVVALLELDGYVASDPQTYAKNNALPTPPLVNILVDNYNGAAGDGQVEVDLDIELMQALAPAIEQIRVYEGPNSNNGMLDVFNEMANPTLGDKLLPPVVSVSWGIAEDEMSRSDVNAESQVLMQMAAQGQSVFVAAGDSGADADGSNLGVGDPASQLYVIGVGGTSLTIKSDGTYGSESTWSDGGGGISTFWPIPSWQQGHMATNAKASTTMRNVPDVSLDADPDTGYSIISENQTVVLGGTSCAAPLWAAFTALVNQQRATNGLEPVGFLTPVLYSMGESSSYATYYHDVADNSTNGFYPAVTGLDDATGWGSFTGTGLLTGMSSGYARRPFTAPTWLDPNAP